MSHNTTEDINSAEFVVDQKELQDAITKALGLARVRHIPAFSPDIPAVSQDTPALNDESQLFVDESPSVVGGDQALDEVLHDLLDNDSVCDLGFDKFDQLAEHVAEATVHAEKKKRKRSRIKADLTVEKAMEREHIASNEHRQKKQKMILETLRVEHAQLMRQNQVMKKILSKQVGGDLVDSILKLASCDMLDSILELMSGE